MSYDIRVWSVVEPVWTDMLSQSDGWCPEGCSCVLRKTTWQIVVGPPLLVEDEDIPDDVIDKLPGIRHLTEINLEPIHAPQSAHTILRSIVNRVAKDSLAVVEDPQEGSIVTPRGVHRIRAAASEERASALELGWWFNESPVLRDNGFHQLVSTMERLLPEALPKRYGSYEPPQYRYADQGKDHFIEFLSKEDLGVVWYPHYPVLSVHIGVYHGYGPSRLGYRANDITVTVHASALSQPGWQLALERFWYGMSNLIRPFYGEIRLMTGYILKKGRIYHDAKTDSHPIKNGWWNGIPRPMGQAVVVGEPYSTLWPRFVERSEQRDGLHFISVDNWLLGKTVDRLVRGVPKDLAQGKYSDPLKRPGGKTSYPKVWPFDGPFSDD